MECLDPPIAPPLLGFVVFCGLFLGAFVDASVHSYVGATFAPKGNAFVLHGGSEGLYASSPDGNATSGSGESFIRYFYLVLSIRYRSEALLIWFVGFRALWGRGLLRGRRLGD